MLRESKQVRDIVESILSDKDWIETGWQTTIVEPQSDTHDAIWATQPLLRDDSVAARR